MNHVAPIRRSYHRDTPECGHGTCGAVVDCTGECMLKQQLLNLPVIDEKFFDEQKLHANLREMGNPMPIQYADEEEDDEGWSEAAIAIAAVVVVFLLIIIFTVATGAFFFSG